MNDLQSVYYLMAEAEALRNEFEEIIEDSFTLRKMNKIFQLLQAFLEELDESEDII